MIGENEFTITFGKEPEVFIPRVSDSETIIQSFEQAKPTKQVYMITGVRGSGKTAMLSYIGRHFREKKDWLVVNLNSDSNLLEELASELYMHNKARTLFTKKELSISFHGITFSLQGDTPVTTPISLAKMMLERLKKKGFKVLICVDEARSTKQMRLFAQAFQTLLREEYPVFLLMTGLFSNICTIQNQPSLTFLLRASRINLGSLNLSAIASAYADAFDFDMPTAHAFAKLTKGFAFAFQVVGMLIYDNKTTAIDNRFLMMVDQYLQDHVYRKIWSDSSIKTQQIFKAMCGNTPIKVGNLLKQSNMGSNIFSSYSIIKMIKHRELA